MDAAIERTINRIYKQKLLQMYIADYVETDNNDVKLDLYPKIKALILELGL